MWWWPRRVRRSRADFDAEIRAHLLLEADQLRAEGLPNDAARDEARRRFGSVSGAMARFVPTPGTGWPDVLARDVRQAVRTFRRDARLAAFAILIVGLGVGASATVFGVVRALLLRPLPFRAPERLVWIGNGDAHDLSARTVQVVHVWRLQAESRTLADVAGYSEFFRAGDHSLTGAGEPERLTGVPVTGRFFPLLGVQPQLGRHFSADEVADGAPPVVLLSHRFWARRLASDPAVVGRALTIDGAPVTVVGVLPESFDFGSVFAPGRRVDYFTPFPMSERTNRQGNTLALVARLRPGATVDAARRELAALAANPPRGDRVNRFAPDVRALREHVSGAFRPAMLVLGGAIGLVMLLVCANLSNLLLTRAAGREREVALRAALGASRQRLVHQLVTESVVLAAAGAALGLVLAALGTRLLAGAEGLDLPLLDQARVDWTVLGVAVAVAVLTGVVVGLLPALRVSARAVHDALRETGRANSAGRRQGRVRGVLVVAEVALACMLLVAAGLLGRSFLRVLDVDLGFRPEHAVAVRIDRSTRFPSQALRMAYYAEALRRVRAAPGIESAGLTDVLPMGFNRMWGYGLPGEQYARGERPSAYMRIVSDGYLRAMGVPLLSGRDFTAADDSASRPVAIVNEALARARWPGQNPIGRLVRTCCERDYEVVGVVAGTRHQALEQESGAELYLSMRQMPDYAALHVIARGPMAPAGIASAVRAALRPMDPTLPMTEVRAMQELVDRSVSPRRLVVQLLVGFAGFALALAALGIYAVISYGVSQRTREFGVRLALGAPGSALRAGVLGETLRLTAAGTALGLAGAWALSRALRALLFGVSASDPLTFAAALALLGAVAAVAGWVPARRASRLDPLVALRSE